MAELLRYADLLRMGFTLPIGTLSRADEDRLLIIRTEQELIAKEQQANG